MKLYCKRKDHINSSTFLVEAAINNSSAIRYASEVEYDICSLAEKVAMLRCLKANTSSLSLNEPESLGYERYDDKKYIEVVEELFWFEEENCDDNHLSDQDYINIANLKYSSEYDRCVIIKSNLVIKNIEQEGTGRDFSFWTEFYKYSYKVVVHKNFKLDLNKEYSLDELIFLKESRDILIVKCYLNKTHDAKDRKVAVTGCKRLNELQPKEWLESVKESGNLFHSEYMTYFRQHINEELINECISVLSDACQKILECPEDKDIRMELRAYKDKYDNLEVFDGMDTNQRLRYVKQYEKSHDLVKKAKKIIANYSEAYRMFRISIIK